MRWVSWRNPHILVKDIVNETVSLDNLERIAPGSVDLVCLPEMAFTGGYQAESSPVQNQ